MSSCTSQLIEQFLIYVDANEATAIKINLILAKKRLQIGFEFFVQKLIAINILNAIK